MMGNVYFLNLRYRSAWCCSPGECINLSIIRVFALRSCDALALGESTMLLFCKYVLGFLGKICCNDYIEVFIKLAYLWPMCYKRNRNNIYQNVYNNHEKNSNKNTASCNLSKRVHLRVAIYFIDKSIVVDKPNLSQTKYYPAAVLTSMYFWACALSM